MTRLLTLIPPLALAFLLTTAHEALAGPGGAIAKAAFKTPLGRILGLILAIILLPLIVYVCIGEWLGVRRTQRDLRRLAEDHPAFAWDGIERWVRGHATELYRCWDQGDLRPCGAFMTQHFFSTQQDLLDRWRDEGKHNVCELKELRRIRPLFVSTGGESTIPTVLVLFNVTLVDYLESTRSRTILKGQKRAIDQDVIWRLVMLPDGAWALHSIEEGELSLAFAREANDVSDTRRLPTAAPAVPAGTSHAPALDPAANVPAAEAEHPVVEVERQHRDR